jgi:hypothetical protein
MAGYFQFEKKFQSRTACICGLEECKEIVKGFRSIQDIRGNVQKLPNSVDDSKKKNIKEFNEHYWKRLLAHRRTGNIDGLAKQNNPKPAQQTKATSQKKVDVYIALWHFDKSLLEHLSRNGNTTGVPKSIDKEAAMKHGFFGSGDCCYSNADVHCQRLNGSNKKNPVVKKSVALVPTFYKTSEAFSDIAKATATFEMYKQLCNFRKTEFLLSNKQELYLRDF